MVDDHGGFDVDSYSNNVLSLCSGVGGLDIGFALGTFGRNRTICYVEREAYTCALLAKRMAEKTLDEAPIWTDVHTFDGRPWRGLVDSICGGYPCQPFSTAGKRHGANDPRHLWPSIVRIIEEIQPRIVFFENVFGHLTLGFDTVCQDLERLGFNVAAGLFSAAEIGAPHERQRLFIVGCSRAGGTVANANGGGHPMRNNGNQSTIPNVGANCIDMANTAGERGEWRMVSEERERLPTFGNNGGIVEDADGIPLFPPGPKDFEQWKRILSDNPHVAPAIESEFHGMVDGFSNRVDRLRACGNAVFPLVAAYAFASLFPVVATNPR